MTNPRTDGLDLYFDLLKRVLTGALAENNDYVLGGERGGNLKHRAANRLGNLAGRTGLELARKRRYDAHVRENGLDHPGRAESMIGLHRMTNLQMCVETVLREDIPGDLIETGVWRGGATIFMRAILKAYGDISRTVWVADSFEGLPKPNAALYPADEGDTHHKFGDLHVGVAQVKDNFRRYGMLDDQVQFLVGWFKDTLPIAPIDKLSVMRLDGDMYESTIQALDNLYPRLSAGGFCIIDDYYHVPGCREAVHAFRHAHQVTEPIEKVDEVGVYWRRAV